MARGVSTGLWAIALQWARLGSAALLLLLAARFLSLAEIGLFAVVFAPVRAAHMALRGRSSMQALCCVTTSDCVARPGCWPWRRGAE